MMRFILSLLFFSWLASTANATDYYFDATSGADGNAGTSSGAPWQTIDKLYDLTQNLNGLTLACGDNIYLKRGETWTANDGTDHIRFTNRPCTPSTPITVDAYSSGADPILDGGTRSSTDYGLRITGSAYITVNNIDFRNWLKINVGTSNHITIADGAASGMYSECFGIRDNVDDITVENMSITNCGVGGVNGEGIYFGTNGVDNSSSTNLVARNNEIFNGGGAWEPIEVKSGIQGVTIEGNYIHDHALGTGGFVGAILVQPGGSGLTPTRNVVIKKNRIENITGSGGDCIRVRGMAEVYQNVIINCGGDGVQVEDPNSDGLARHIFRNSIRGATGACTTGTGSGYNAKNNACWANGSGNDASDPLFASTTDLRLTAGSPAIDGGVADSADGLPKNGSAITRGAFDPPRFSSCVVENATPNRDDVTFTNNVAPPIITGAVTGITIQVAAGDRTESAPTVSGTNIIQYTIDGAAVSNGQAVTWAAAATNTITDTSLVGNSLNQPFLAITAQNCTNNVGAGAPSYTITQTASRLEFLAGTEAAAEELTTAAAKIRNVPLEGSFWVRNQITITGANAPALGFKLQFDTNGGGAADVPASGADINFFGTTDLSGVTIRAQGTATENKLSCASFVAGLAVRTPNAIPTIQLDQNECIDLVHALKVAATATIGNLHCFDLKDQGGTATVLNTVRNCIRVTGYQAHR